MELKKVRNINTKALFANVDGPRLSASVEDNNATKLTTKSDI
jgi:hypothetical protein